MTRRLASVLLLLSGACVLPPAVSYASAAAAVRHDGGGGRQAPLLVAAAPFRGSGAHASVLLAVELHARALLPADAMADELTVEYVAVDASGRAYEGKLTLDAAGRAGASRDRLRATAWLELPGGAYELRVSTRTRGGAATATHRLDVPDFRAPLSMSGVAVGTTADQAAAPAAPGPAGLRLAASPVARRAFRTGETLILFNEVYESDERLARSPARRAATEGRPTPRGDHTTHVFAQILDEDGSILVMAPGLRAPTRASGPGLHAFATPVPLVGVPPGRYVLRVRARANIGAPDTTWEDIPIAVE